MYSVNRFIPDAPNMSVVLCSEHRCVYYVYIYILYTTPNPDSYIRIIVVIVRCVNNTRPPRLNVPRFIVFTVIRNE